MAFIARGVDYKNKDVLQQLCTALIRPHLGHCVYFWSLYIQEDIFATEEMKLSFIGLITRTVGPCTWGEHQLDCIHQSLEESEEI